MTQMTQQQRAVSLVSGLFFLGSMVTAAASVYTAAIARPEAIPTPVIDNSLEQQAQGYEIVLKREPDNQTALEGLAKTRLELNDQKGAIAPLEKLVQLHPNRVDYQALLQEAKQASVR